MTEENHNIASEVQPMAEQPKERLFTQNEMNEVVGRVRQEASRRTKQELQKEIDTYYAQAETERQSRDTTDLATLVDKQVEARLSGIVEEMNRSEAVRQADEQKSLFFKKMGDEAFSPDVAAVLSDKSYNFSALSSVLPVLNEIEETRAVFEHLIQNPDQLAILSNCMQTQGPAAARKLVTSKLVKGIKANAGKDKNLTNEPLPQLKNHSASGSPSTPSSDWSVDDMRKYLQSSRRR